MKHYENVIFPEHCKGIIDVTKAPYFADNTEKNDCTEVLCKIESVYLILLDICVLCGKINRIAIDA